MPCVLGCCWFACTILVNWLSACPKHILHNDVTKTCSTKWKRILELEEKLNLEKDEQEELEVLKWSFNLVLATDYQISKLIPFWGRSPQPRSTYYSQKLSHNIFGIVNHATNKSSVYMFDERVGPKNTNHILSYMIHYIDQLPDWIRRIHIYMDNTSSTNKNCYTMAWSLEMIAQRKLVSSYRLHYNVGVGFGSGTETKRKLDFIYISLLIAGHTKFSPDLLFFLLWLLKPTTSWMSSMHRSYKKWLPHTLMSSLIKVK